MLDDGKVLADGRQSLSLQTAFLKKLAQLIFRDKSRKINWAWC